MERRVFRYRSLQGDFESVDSKGARDLCRTSGFTNDILIMKKFIIVDTFNGTGYSESLASIKEFESDSEVVQFAHDLAKEFCQDNGSLVVLDNKVEYGVNKTDDGDFEDQGAVHFEELPEGIVSVTIDPTINSYTLHDLESDAEVVQRIIKESDEFEELGDLEDCHHLDDEVLIYQKLNP
jgi:hypothetical protein